MATQYAPAPLLPRGRPSALRATEQMQHSSTFPRRIHSHTDRCSRLTRYGRAESSGLVTLTFELLTWKVVSESRVTWATSVPILVFLGISVLVLGPMYATDRRQTKHSLMPPPIRGGDLITDNKTQINNRLYVYYSICTDDWQGTTDSLSTLERVLLHH